MIPSDTNIPKFTAALEIFQKFVVVQRLKKQTACKRRANLYASQTSCRNNSAAVAAALQCHSVTPIDSNLSMVFGKLLAVAAAAVTTVGLATAATQRDLAAAAAACATMICTRVDGYAIFNGKAHRSSFRLCGKFSSKSESSSSTSSSNRKDCYFHIRFEEVAHLAALLPRPFCVAVIAATQ